MIVQTASWQMVRSSSVGFSGLSKSSLPPIPETILPTIGLPLLPGWMVLLTASRSVTVPSVMDKWSLKVDSHGDNNVEKWH